MAHQKTDQKPRALITGASSGIGADVARKLAAQGMDLVIAARRKDRLEALAQEIKKSFPVEVECIESDLTQINSVQKLFDAATAGGKIVSVLVNNAGIGKYGPFLEFPLEAHQNTVRVNSEAPMELCYLFSKHMLAHGRPSHILNVASIAAYQPVAYFSVYSGTKGYLMYFSEALAFELKNTNVKVTCLCPGGTHTEFLAIAGQELTSSGHSTMMTSEAVAELGVRAMLRGQVICVPGFLNQLACFFPRFFPRRFGLWLAFKTMGKAVNRV
jgi:short-subunit dehydrogenase